MELWIVGESLEGDDSWAFVGVYDSQKKAEDACITENYFVGPATLNETSPLEIVEWLGAYYPKEQTGE